MLLTVIFLLAIVTVWLSVAVPKMTRSIQRDREVETMHRGKQYIRAVQLYYRKFHAYPPNMDALVKTNEIRFLRKKYIDPMTGKDDWKPLMFGQNKQPIVFGFFGQPLATGSTLAGIGMSGGNGINGLNGAAGANGAGFGTPGASGTLGSIFNSQQSASTTTTPGSTTGPGANGTDSSGNGTGTDASGGTGATDANGNPISGSGSNGLSGSGPMAGQTFGGAGIIGVTPASPKVSILIYKKKDHYNEWEFDYDPMMEQMMMQGGNTGMIGNPASSMSNPIGNSGFGSTTNTFGGGQTSSTPFSAGPGSQSPTTPTNPQQ
jgi:type II secretory pathway pseudopilin PulG